MVCDDWWFFYVLGKFVVFVLFWVCSNGFFSSLMILSICYLEISFVFVRVFLLVWLKLGETDDGVKIPPFFEKKKNFVLWL